MNAAYPNVAPAARVRQPALTGYNGGNPAMPGPQMPQQQYAQNVTQLAGGYMHPQGQFPVPNMPRMLRPSQVQKWIKETYNGSGDPYDHVAIFTQVIRAEQVTDFRVQYKGFGLTLKGKALTWFNTLDHGRFHTIAQLTQEFIEKFTKTGIKHNSVAILHSFKQAKKESVKDAASRF